MLTVYPASLSRASLQSTNHLFKYFVDAIEEWQAVEYTFVNYLLWVLGLCLIVFPIIGLIVVQILAYKRGKIGHWHHVLMRRRLAIDYRRPSAVWQPPADSRVSLTESTIIDVGDKKTVFDTRSMTPVDSAYTTRTTVSLDD